MANENSVTKNTNSAVGAIAPAASAAPPASAVPAVAPPQALLYRDAYEQVLAATAAIKEDEIVPVNIDVPSAVVTTIGSLPKILAYRAEAEKLPGFDIAHFDNLKLHTFAVGHSHAKFLHASAPPEELASLNERGVKLRDTIYLDAVALANRGVINGERVGSFKANLGYKNIAFDLLGLADLLRESWEKIASRTGIQLSELDQAEQLGQQLMDAVGIREQSPATLAQAQAQRQRNFTLFSRSYDQVRRAISFLRWDNDDVEQICPSLYAGHGGSRRKETPAPVVPPPDSTVPPAGTPAPSIAPASGKAPAAPGVGLPNGNPFATGATS